MRGRASVWIPENYLGDDAVSWKRRMGEDHGNAQIARMQRFPDAEKRERGEIFTGKEQRRGAPEIGITPLSGITRECVIFAGPPRLSSSP